MQQNNTALVAAIILICFTFQQRRNTCTAPLNRHKDQDKTLINKPDQLFDTRYSTSHRVLGRNGVQTRTVPSFHDLRRLPHIFLSNARHIFAYTTGIRKITSPHIPYITSLQQHPAAYIFHHLLLLILPLPHPLRVLSYLAR